MKNALLTCLFIGLISPVFAQYEGIYELPLPEKFRSMTKSVGLKSVPNPNLPEFNSPEQKEIIWHHSTTITANEKLTIVEAGAYLLNYGEWKLRVAFKPKEIKEKFQCKSLHLKPGESITFPNNDRYGSFTETGWNFWYVIAENSSGEKVFGYEILQTSGKMADDLQVLPLLSSQSSINWAGKASDSDYTLAGTLRPSGGRLLVRNEQLVGGELSIDMSSIQHSDKQLVKHLRNDDFFAVKSFPKSSFVIESVSDNGDGTYELKGQLTVLGISQAESLFVQWTSTEKSYEVSGTLMMDRTRYGILYGSSKAANGNYSIADNMEIKFQFVFRKDFPGSMPWNSIYPR